MTELELLNQQIQTMSEQGSYHICFAIIGLIITVAGVIKSEEFFGKAMIPMGATVVMISLILAYSNVTERNELIEQRDELIRDNFRNLSCNDMRLKILEIMEKELKDILESDKSMYYIEKDELEYFKDYYYHKCEIPLREEVMKLQ